MKKLLSMMLAGLLAVSLTACGGDSAVKVETQELGKSDVGYISAPKGDYEILLEEEGTVTYYNNDNDAIIDLFNTLEYAAEMSLDDMGEYTLEFYSGESESTNLELSDGKYGDKDAKIISGDYIDSVFDEKFEVYGWIFEIEPGKYGIVIIEARPADMEIAKSVIDGTFVEK